jgi:hypothetical protein
MIVRGIRPETGRFLLTIKDGARGRGDAQSGPVIVRGIRLETGRFLLTIKDGARGRGTDGAEAEAERGGR